MNMYNMLCGENEASEVILKTIGLTKSDFGRFRDVGFEVDSSQIIVLTRCGGGNRDSYQDVFDRMHEHPLFIEDKDDDFDSTYCTFSFKIPEELCKRIAMEKQQ